MWVIFLLAVGLAAAAPPTYNVTYVIKSGEVLGTSLELAEFEATFDNDVGSPTAEFII